MPKVLRLDVPGYTDPARWRWRLTDTATGAFLADHDVELDPGDWQYEAFRDLRHYLSWHVTYDEHTTYDAYVAEERRIVTDVGTWTGGQVFGTAIMNVLARHRNAAVRVTLPDDAEALAFLPLELARTTDGQTLADLGVTLVIETGDAPGQPKEPVGDRLRVLGLFSLPDGGSPLNLRRERHELVDLIRGIAANGRAADIKVLQYGVTRDRLRDVLQEAEGWDIIHVSGHGAPGHLLLETATGAPDLIDAADLADLLDLARDRVKVVTIAACWSAALTANEQRRLLHLPIPDNQRHITAERPEASPPAQAPGALATELTSRLDCAVVAMRYPVADDFAIELSGKLYALLADKGQSLPRAVAMTLQDLARDDRHGQPYAALSMAAPAVFGTTAAELILRAPDRTGPVSYATENLKLAGFPPQPGRFVGRTGVMARASAALAAESRVPGVLLHGMPGGGKTACALELAYTHEDAFEGLIWFKAPDEGMEIGGSLTDFTLKLEAAVEGLPLVDKLTDGKKLTAFLPVLTKLMNRNRLLIVIDNAESLLTDGGTWRDEQWGAVIGALTTHRGLGRVILTSRRVPADTRDLQIESVDALTADEALLLARELPNLRALINGELPGIDRDTARTLALGVLTTAQGHPKLLELADGQAAHPGQVTALVEASDQAWQNQGGLPDGFFTIGATSSNPGDYLQVLAAWTKSVTGTLSLGERDLFWFLCCLEESDREQPIVEPLWPRLWQWLDHDGQPPGLGAALTELTARGLTTIRKGTDGKSESLAIHPGIASDGRAHAGSAIQAAVDFEAGEFWTEAYMRASGENDDGKVDTRLLVRAGLAAVPYLLRRERWDLAADLLDDAFIRDPSRASAAAMLPAVTRIADHAPRHANTLARILGALDPAAAETLLRDSLDRAAAHSDHQAAALAAGQLANLRLASARLAEALALIDTAADSTRRAGLGPWTQLAEQVRRLQVLAAMGHATQVLDEVHELRRYMDTLPDRPGDNEAIPPWHVREGLFHTGHHAAADLERWQDALNLNAELIASLHARYAPSNDIARARFGDYYSLIQLGRTDEALDLLQDCLHAFRDTGDIEMIGGTLSALASTENRRGHGDAALRLQRDALRHEYVGSDVHSIAVSYHNLGNYLGDHARQPSAAVSAHLVAALIRGLTGIGGTGPDSASRSVREAAADLREFGTDAEPPTDIADLCDRLADIEGTDLPGLIAKLSPDPQTAERTLQDLIAQARALAETPPGVQDND